MNTESKSCKNCKFFIQHYAKRKTYLQKIECAHCGGKRLTANEKRNFPFLCGCESWEPLEQSTNISKENLLQTLNEIYTRLNILICELFDGNTKN